MRQDIGNYLMQTGFDVAPQMLQNITGKDFRAVFQHLVTCLDPLWPFELELRFEEHFMQALRALKYPYLGVIDPRWLSTPAAMLLLMLGPTILLALRRAEGRWSVRQILAGSSANFPFADCVAVTAQRERSHFRIFGSGLFDSWGLGNIEVLFAKIAKGILIVFHSSV